MKLFGTRWFERRRYIGGQVNPLVIRWILFRIPAFGIMLHKLCRSDYDRALHNHPWPFVTIILRGGYTEVHDQTNDRQETREWRGPGSVLLRPGQWRHRVEMNRPAWSLVITGRRFQQWGFFLPEGWCWWRRHNPELNICEDEIIHHGGQD